MKAWMVFCLVLGINGVGAACVAEGDFPEGPNFRTGTATHFEQGWDPAKIMPLVRAAGFGWIRDEVRWGEIERETGQYALSEKTQQWLQEAKRNDLRVILILNYSNPLYADRYDPEAYANAAAWLAKQAADQVDAIEILNEPQNFGFSGYYGGAWNGRQPDGSDAPWTFRYVRLLNKAAGAIKAANPRMKVIGLGSVPPSNFRMLRQGIGPAVDAVVDHPYSFRGMPEFVPYEATERHLERDGLATADRAGTFSSQLAMYRSESESSHGPRELWLTEWGFPTFIKLNPLGLFDGVSEIVQAKYILRRFVEALALEVEVSIQYDFRNDGLNAFNPEHNFGLVDFALRTKPAFNAVQRVNRFLRDCNPDSLLKVSISPLTSALTEPIRCYGFRASNGRVLFAIWRAIAATDEQLTLHSIITLASAREIRSLHSVNLLNGETKAVSFSSLNGNAIVTDLEIYDYPILLIGRK